MQYITRTTISPSGKTNYLHYTAKQYDRNSRVFICTLSDNATALTSANTAKAVAYRRNQTIDIMDCIVNIAEKTITFTLSERCLYNYGSLYIDVIIFEDEIVKLTCGAIIVDVIQSGNINIPNIQTEDSLYNLLKQFSNIAPYIMGYITEKITMLSSTIYTVQTDKIAYSSPVTVHITYGSSNSKLTRSDGVELIDKLTNKVVDSNMNDIKITTQDVIAGLQMTQGGSIEISYYNANCEDLLQMINNSSSYKVLQTNYSTLETSTEYEVIEKSEVEI